MNHSYAPPLRMDDSQLAVSRQSLSQRAGDSAAATGVTAGSYTYSSLTVNAKGQLTSASSGVTPRVLLTGARTYYVRTDGNDSNTGLVDSAGGAFLTIQKAVNVVSASIDNAGYDVTIDLGDGTYAEAVTLKSFVGSGTVYIQGNSGTPANVVVNATGSCFLADGVSGIYYVKDLKCTATSAALRALNHSTIYFGNLNFGACTLYHIVSQTASLVWGQTSYAISGAAAYHYWCGDGGNLWAYALTVTLTGTPAFTQTAYVYRLGNLVIPANTYSGSATGTRFYVAKNSTCDVGGAGANYIPGNAAGSTATGGEYS